MQSHQELREFIKTKFGKIRLFLDASGLGESERKFLHRSDDFISTHELQRIKSMYALADNLNPGDDKTILTDEEIKAIRQCIWKVYGGTKPMGEQHKDWSESAASNLVNGRLKRRSPRVKKLMEHLSKCMEEMKPLFDKELQHSVEILNKSISK